MKQQVKDQEYNDINKQEERESAVLWVIGTVLAFSLLQYLTTG